MRYLILLLGLFLTTPVLARHHPTAQGRNGMVVSAQYIATHVGRRILQEGGNAVDAAVAMAYTLAVVHPCCGNLGGGGFMLIHSGKKNKNLFINFREMAPARIKPNMLKDNHMRSLEDAYKTVGVPGTVLGLNTVLARFGTMPLKELIQPAIDRADKGYTLTKDDVQFLNYAVDHFKNDPNVAKIFLNQGRPFQPGDTLIQHDLAKTLREIAKDGSSAFYHGDIMTKIVAASQKHNGVLTQKDFANYKISMMKPITCNYRGYEVITAPPPSSGGVTICQILNIAEHYPIKKFGYQSLNTLHDNIEAMRYAYSDKLRYIGDPDFVKIPVDALISKKYASLVYDKIQKNGVTDSTKIRPKIEYKEGMHTTSFVVVDTFGNVVNVTYTINSFFGGRIIPEDTGILLNDELRDFSFRNKKMPELIRNKNPNSVAPGKRPVSSISPTIILKDGKFFMALSTPGGPTIPSQTIGVIENVIDFGMSLHNAVNAPRYHMQWWPDVVYIEPNALSRRKIAKLSKMGYRIHVGSPLGFPYWGGVAAVMSDGHGGYLGVMDGRRPGGLALGY